MSVVGDAKPCFTREAKPSWEIRLRTLLLKVMNDVFYVLQKSDTTFCLTVINTVINEPFGDEYTTMLKLNQRWLYAGLLVTTSQHFRAPILLFLCYCS